MGWREQTLLHFNVEGGTGDFRGKLGVYNRACPPRKRKGILMLATIFWGGAVIVYLLQQVVADSLQKSFHAIVFLAITYFTIVG